MDHSLPKKRSLFDATQMLVVESDANAPVPLSKSFLFLITFRSASLPGLLSLRGRDEYAKPGEQLELVDNIQLKEGHPLIKLTPGSTPSFRDSVCRPPRPS